MNYLLAIVLALPVFCRANTENDCERELSWREALTHQELRSFLKAAKIPRAVDEGQKAYGQWLSLKVEFEGHLKKLANDVIEATHKDHGGYIYAVARNAPRTRYLLHGIDDVVSATYLRLLESFHRNYDNLLRYLTIQDKSAITRYLSGIVSHVAVDFSRKISNRKGPQTVWAPEAVAIQPEPATDIESIGHQKLPSEQLALALLGDLTNENVAKLKMSENVTFDDLAERQRLLESNIEKLQRLRSGAHRKERQSTMMEVYPIQEDSFYNYLALLKNETSRWILGLRLIAEYDRNEIAQAMNLSIRQVDDRLSTAMDQLHRVMRLSENEKRKVRLDTIVVMLRENRLLLAERSRFYAPIDNKENQQLAKTILTNTDGATLPDNDDVYRKLLSLIHPKRALVIDLILRLNFSHDEVMRRLQLRSLDEVLVLYKFGVEDIKMIAKIEDPQKKLNQLISDSRLTKSDHLNLRETERHQIGLSTYP